jgi:hypothetical protein
MHMHMAQYQGVLQMINKVTTFYKSRTSSQTRKLVFKTVVRLKQTRSDISIKLVEQQLQEAGTPTTHYEVLCCLRYFVYSGFRFIRLDYSKTHYFL